MLIQTIMLCLLASTFAYSDEGMKSSREILLNATQESAMSLDRPFQSIFLQTESKLFALGQRFLWRIDLNTSDVKKIAFLPENTEEKPQSMAGLNTLLYLATNRSLYRLNTDTSELERFQAATQSDLKTLSIILPQTSDPIEPVLWLTSTVIFRLNPKENILKTHFQFQSPLLAKNAVIAGGDLWFVEGTGFLKIQLNQDALTTVEKIYQSQTPFIGLKKDLESVYGYTKNAILRFSLEGKLIQTVPVEGDHSLVGMLMDENSHGFLFSDRILELKNVKDKTTQFYYLDLGFVRKAEQQNQQKSMVSMIADGRIRVFQLSGLW